MTEDDIRQFDEANTVILRTIPGFLWSLFSEFKVQGFSEVQALELTKEYLRTIQGK